ncbi:MAG: hypothetical protein PWR20_1161, partial [Bacteroidales bacterium]|nr:hypothetical protein [Bacteroidales bacterium]
MKSVYTWMFFIVLAGTIFFS